MTGFRISTQGSLLGLDRRYRTVLAAQQERLGPLLAGLTDDEWRTSSRNPAWTVHQTMQHVAGVRLEIARVNDGGERTWSADFDPNRSPQEDIDARAGEAPSETLRGHRDVTERLLDQLSERSVSEEQQPMLWGEPADFRLFYLHLHWDSWVHERDMLVPLGRLHEVDAESTRFALAYGLLIAGVGVRMAGQDLEATIATPDVGDVALTVTPDEIAVEVDAAGDGPRHDAPDSGALVDALSGRGDLASTLDAPDDVVAALTIFASFLRG